MEALIYLVSVDKQEAKFSNGRTITVPYCLTCKAVEGKDDEFILILDRNKKTITLPSPCSKKTFILHINIFLIDVWKLDGKPQNGKPEKIIYEE